MNYTTVQQIHDTRRGQVAYASYHSEQIDSSGHGPFTCKASEGAKAHRRVLTVCIYAIDSKDEIGPVDAY